MLIATKDGEATIGETIGHAAQQADVFVVSDGSTDATVAEARDAGAEVLELETNVGKPTALRQAFDHFQIAERYAHILVCDDDTRLDPSFVARAVEPFDDPNVVVSCGETRSDWRHEQRWNPWIASRALAYWRYGLFVKRGQAALRAITVIPGSNSVFRTSMMQQLLAMDVPYVVDDTAWVLEIQTKKLGRVAYVPEAKAYVQDPTTAGDWYRQMLRWMWGTFQGIRGHRIGRQMSWFSVTYAAMILDWILYLLAWPALAVVVATTAWNTRGASGLLTFLTIYCAGYLLWATIGAIALRRWRLIPLFPMLIVVDWMLRANMVHAAIKAWRQPTSECKWESPQRFSTRAEPSTSAPTSEPMMEGGLV